MDDEKDGTLIVHLSNQENPYKNQAYADNMENYWPEAGYSFSTDKLEVNGVAPDWEAPEEMSAYTFELKSLLDNEQKTVRMIHSSIWKDSSYQLQQLSEYILTQQTMYPGTAVLIYCADAPSGTPATVNTFRLSINLQLLTR